VEMGSGTEAAAVAVQMWRHTLMHTGMPEFFKLNGTNGS
jgi:hypothetical protein